MEHCISHQAHSLQQKLKGFKRLERGVAHDERANRLRVRVRAKLAALAIAPQRPNQTVEQLAGAPIERGD